MLHVGRFQASKIMYVLLCYDDQLVFMHWKSYVLSQKVSPKQFQTLGLTTEPLVPCCTNIQMFSRGSQEPRLAGCMENGELRPTEKTEQRIRERHKYRCFGETLDRTFCLFAQKAACNTCPTRVSSPQHNHCTSLSILVLVYIVVFNRSHFINCITLGDYDQFIQNCQRINDTSVRLLSEDSYLLAQICHCNVCLDAYNFSSQKGKSHEVSRYGYAYGLKVIPPDFRNLLEAPKLEAQPPLPPY